MKKKPSLKRSPFCTNIPRIMTIWDQNFHCRARQVVHPLPKLVFNRVNGKRPPLMISPPTTIEENYTVAHEENVRFVYEAWQQVEEQLHSQEQGDGGSGPIQYTEKTPSPELKALSESASCPQQSESSFYRPPKDGWMGQP
ncbi:MAPK regulated corepressor interacting protein 2 isoform X3 [Pituophis catenifer annectens]|uniref:MAPK regulated corepressor interacting protein 2 isoform X3 n=1 Tax=Pituophis catenifer annectens TaxID=94852 RepID=UPI0039965F2C